MIERNLALLFVLWATPHGAAARRLAARASPLHRRSPLLPPPARPRPPSTSCSRISLWSARARRLLLLLLPRGRLLLAKQQPQAGASISAAEEAAELVALQRSGPRPEGCGRHCAARSVHVPREGTQNSIPSCVLCTRE